MRAFDNPTMLAEAIVLLDVAACNSWVDAPLTQMPTTPCELIPLVGVELVGALRGRPGSPGTTGMTSTRASKTTESCRLAPVTASAKGTPRRPTTRWRLVPSLPRSVGFGPVCWLPGWPQPHHRYSPDSNRPGHAHAIASAGPGESVPRCRWPTNHEGDASKAGFGANRKPLTRSSWRPGHVWRVVNNRCAAQCANHHGTRLPQLCRNRTIS